MPTPLVIETEIFEQLEQVRQDGGTNMMDRQGVQVIANEMSLYALVVYAEDARHTWGTVLRQFGEWIEAQRSG
jgi:hypothetical protein